MNSYIATGNSSRMRSTVKGKNMI